MSKEFWLSQIEVFVRQYKEEYDHDQSCSRYHAFEVTGTAYEILCEEDREFDRYKFITFMSSCLLFKDDDRNHQSFYEAFRDLFERAWTRNTLSESPKRARVEQSPSEHVKPSGPVVK